MLTKMKEQKEVTDRKKGGKDKGDRLQESSRSQSDGVMWRTKQQSGNRLVTFNDVLSVEASFCLCSATGGKDVHVRTHIYTHTSMHKHTVLMNWSRSLSMQNQSLHNKLPTNRWGEIHPLDTLQCARSYRTNCAPCLCSRPTRRLLSLSVPVARDLPMASQLGFGDLHARNILSQQQLEM